MLTGGQGGKLWDGGGDAAIGLLCCMRSGGICFSSIHLSGTKGVMRRYGREGMRLTGVPVVLLILLWSAERLEALTPPTVTADAGAGPSWLIRGDIGRLTKRGSTYSLKTSVAWTYLGVVFGISRASYLTKQVPPPYGALIDFYDFQVGVTVVYRILGFGIHFDPSYRRLGIMSNSLIKETGAVSGYHAAGGDLEVSYQISNFRVALRGTAQYLFTATSVQLGLLVAVGVSFGP